MKKAASFQGGVSILLILLMLTLTAFGLLTLVSAHSDYKLSQKNKESIDRFYALDTQGQQALRDLAASMGQGPYSAQAVHAAGWSVTGEFPLSAGRTWEQDGVTLTAEVVWDETGQMAIQQWCISHPDFVYDQSLHVWEGE